jgi:hypothetical protein
VWGDIIGNERSNCSVANAGVDTAASRGAVVTLAGIVDAVWPRARRAVIGGVKSFELD